MSEISQWLSGLGLEKYGPAFAEAEIEFGDLSDLSDEDLKELGLPMGPRRRVAKAIKHLNGGSDPSGTAPTLSSPPVPQPSDPADTSSDAERRHLTVMFVDLVGSTEMAGRLDPEDMRNVITGYQNTVAGVVTRYEGFVAKFMGDGVLCYFGWPRANEDDAERAVRAGLDIITAVRATSGPDGMPLASRVGIATGVVIVGDLIGSGATQEAAVVGETPNLAARLQGLAAPNQIVLPQQTLSLLGNAFALEPLGSHALKGIAEPVDAYAVTGEAARESRFDARQSGTLTPIVGREQELGLMGECWTKAKAGAGQMIVVSGEAGIGKSRITRALIDEIAADDHIRMTYQCSPYHTESAFYPVIQQLSYAAGIHPSDGQGERLDKLENLVGANTRDAALLAALLDIDAAGRQKPLDLSPAQLRAQTMQVLIDQLVRQAKDKPLLAVFEDLHWVDPTTLELLDIALDAMADKSILILATARPTFEHGFGGHPIVTRFALNRLGRDQIQSIVSKLTGGKALPEEVLAIIAERTDGVPLFVEELTKTILETGVLKPDGNRLVLDGPLDALAIPNTLHDSLMARLDRLQPIKEVAQTAACIGREFDHRLLASISPLPETELENALDGLIKAELIYRRGLPPEATYLFKHALVRDAAYESLLKERRRSVHAQILASLEDDTNIAPEVLAHHAEAAGLTERAIDLWEAASKAAIARPAYDEGISHLEHAIALSAPEVEGGERTALEHALSLQLQLAMAFLARWGYGADETKVAFEYALVLADRVGETPLRFLVLYGLWVGMWIRAEHADALQQAEALVDLTKSSPETAPTFTAHRILGTSLTLQGRFTEAQAQFDQAMALYDPVAHKGLENRFGQDLAVAIHVYKAINMALLGETAGAEKHAMDAERLALATGHANTICYMHTHLVIFAVILRDAAAEQQHHNALALISAEHKLALWQVFAAIAEGNISAGIGDPAGIEHYKTADTGYFAARNRAYLPVYRIEVGRRALAMGLPKQAGELAAMAQSLIDVSGEAFALSDLWRLKGALALDAGDRLEAEANLKLGVAVAQDQGSKLWALRAAIDLANLWQSDGRTDEAVTLLGPIVDSIADGDCPEDRAKAQAMLKAMKASH